MDKMVIIDGHNLLFRMFYGMPNKIYSKNGKCIHGLIGFVGSINKVIKEYNPKDLIVVFDSQQVSAKFDDEIYKKNRIMDFSHLPDDENPFSGFDDIIKALDLIRITHIEIPYQEADDIICSIAKQSQENNEVIIVSTDKDFFQVLSNKISVLSPRGKLSILYTPEVFHQKYDIQVNQYIDFKALTGDPSDNINGVKGIGNKTASSLLTQYTSIKGIYENLDKLTPRIRRLLSDESEKLKKNIDLLKINSDIDINLNLYDSKFHKVWKTRDIVDRVIEDDQT